MLPDCQHEQERPHRQLVIIGLVFAHLAVGVTLGACVRLFGYDSDSVVGILFVGLAFSQVGLIGLWSALGSASWRLRLAGLLLGPAYVAVGFAVAVDENGWKTYYIFAFATGLVTAGLAVLRHFRYRLAVSPYEGKPVSPFQFGIRHLLILTLLTAVTLTLLLNLEIGLSSFGWLLLMTPVALPFIAVALVMPWAMLGQSRLPIRGTVLLVVTAVAAWGVFRLWRELDLIWMVLAEASVLMATLLIVRICGYRLVRQGKVTASELPRE